MADWEKMETEEHGPKEGRRDAAAKVCSTARSDEGYQSLAKAQTCSWRGIGE